MSANTEPSLDDRLWNLRDWLEGSDELMHARTINDAGKAIRDTEATLIQRTLLLGKAWGAIQNALNSGDIQDLRDVARDLERVLGITAEFEPPGWEINPEYETASIAFEPHSFEDFTAPCVVTGGDGIKSGIIVVSSAEEVIQAVPVAP